MEICRESGTNHNFYHITYGVTTLVNDFVVMSFVCETVANNDRRAKLKSVNKFAG